jgi:hypothetical protein
MTMTVTEAPHAGQKHDPSAPLLPAGAAQKQLQLLHLLLLSAVV